MGDEKTIEDAAEYVKDFLAQRLPGENLSGNEDDYF